MSQTILAAQTTPDGLQKTPKQLRAEALHQHMRAAQQQLMLRPSSGPPDEFWQQHFAEQRMQRPNAGLRPIADTLSGRQTQRSRANARAEPGYQTARQLRRSGGPCGQAAVLLEQGARWDPDPESAAKKRAIAELAKDMAGRQNLEFNFMRGNFHLGDEFVDASFTRIADVARTPVQRSHAISQILAIARWMRWQNHECMKSVSELANYRRVGRGQAVRDNRVLLAAGLILFVPRGRTSVIVVNPEGIFRGKVYENHSATVFAYRAAVHPDRMSE